MHNMSVTIEKAGSNELWPQVLQAMSRGVLSKVIVESRRISAFKTVSEHCARATWFYKYILMKAAIVCRWFLLYGLVSFPWT